MNKKIFIITILIIAPCCTFAQQASYDVASIPAALKEGAHVVKRFEEITFNVKDIDRASYTVHQAYTILDDEGKDMLDFEIRTNKLEKIDEVDIRVYDSSGIQINRFRKKDLNKQAGMYGLVEDGMYYYLRISASSYPVTVEYNYETDLTGTLSYPPYYIQLPGEAVESSSYSAIIPPDLDLRFMEQRIQLKPSISYFGKSKIYKWEIKNLLAYKHEEGAVSAGFYYPAIILAPNKFKHFNTYGEMSSWKSFGKWGYDLSNGLDELTPERKEFLANLVKAARSDREKVAIIYKYLQQNFRYVSIQLGIGGFKPFPAQFTDEKKYGDCKGLSTYMYSALKAVGIKSYCAYINAAYNQEPVPESFPCYRFNHMILCVPQSKDTIWLECTSNSAEFAVLGNFTENRNALLLTENGGVLVRTPSSKALNNSLCSITNIKLTEDGSGTTATTISSKGDYKEMINAMVTAKKDDQKMMIVKYLGFKQPDEFSVVKKSEAEFLNVSIDLSMEKIPQFSAGSKMFLNPRVYSLWRSVLPKAEDRKQDYYFQAPFIRTDTTIYQLPENYVAESIPAPSALQCSYGSFSSNYTYVKDKNQLVSVARLELVQNRIPSSKYSEVKKFFDGVLSEDSHKIVIKRN